MQKTNLISFTVVELWGHLLKFEEFENAIANLMNLNDVNLVSEMCKAFDDNTKEREVMYGLVNAIEVFDDEEYFYQIIKAFPSMIKNAKSWLKTLHYGILNDAPSRQMYGNILTSKIEKSTVNRIIDLLNEIKQEKPKFINQIDDILNQLVNN